MAPSMRMRCPILYEDNHLLVVNKPAGWVTQGALKEHTSLIEEASNYLRIKYSKPGDVFLGVVSRLDALVTGVLPLARTSKAAARLSQQFRERSVVKKYWAVLDGRLAEPCGRLEHWLYRDEKHFVTRLGSANQPGAQLAILDYEQLIAWANRSLIAITLHSGRKHQIRAQFSILNCPILGDSKYGSNSALPRGIALHCHLIGLRHPTKQVDMRWTAQAPRDWQTTGIPLEYIET